MSKNKMRLIQLLLALYPKQWRQEYGEEFSGLLETRPLRPETVLNVGWSALVQRWRDGEPWFIVGTLCMCINLIGTGAAFCLGIPTDLRAFWGSQALLSTLFSIAALFSVGFWTAARSDRVGSKPGRAAIKTALLSSWTLLVTALLMLAHAVPMMIVEPGGTGHPFAFVYRDTSPPSHGPLWFLPWIFFISFFLNIPVAGMIGLIGGMTGRFTRWAARRGQAGAN